MSTGETETIAFRMVMNAGQAAEYRRRHDEIWAELRDELLARGVLDYRIFLDEATNHLFAVMTRRRDHRLADLPDTPVMRRWWAMMGDIMETNADQSPTEQPLTPMFALTVGG
jgi:L-rhamnose mutarotase